MIPRYQSEAMNKIWSDSAKFACWLEIEIAHLKAQGTNEELVTLFKEKQKTMDWAVFLDRVNKHEAYLKHDVIAFLRALEDEFGKSASKLHRGLTSSDIVDTAFALQLKKAGALLRAQLRRLINALWQRAHEGRGRLCIGRTHGQAAQPLTFGIKLLGHVCELARGHQRLIDACNDIAVGKLSGAVGTYAYSNAEVENVALSFLGLKPETVSTQIVARDRHAHFFCTLAIIAGSLERLALELRLLMHGQVKEASEAFVERQQGSSAMPHKKNPVSCENITGLMRLVRSYSLAILENQALWHERDISHSSVERVVALDATSLMDFALQRMTKVVQNMTVDFMRMNDNLEQVGLSITSQAAMMALMDKGLWRSKAYELVQKAALSSNTNFQHALKEAGILEWLSEDELELVLTPAAFISSEELLFARTRETLGDILDLE